MTNDSGAYTTGLLVLGPYTVKVNLQGFKTSVTSGLNLRGGDVVRQDVTLQVGQLTETVDVTAEEGLNITQPDVTHKWTRSTTRISRSSPPPTCAWPSPCS